MQKEKEFFGFEMEPFNLKEEKQARLIDHQGNYLFQNKSSVRAQDAWLDSAPSLYSIPPIPKDSPQQALPAPKTSFDLLTLYTALQELLSSDQLSIAAIIARIKPTNTIKITKKNIRKNTTF